jgi:hypothetical protein
VFGWISTVGVWIQIDVHLFWIDAGGRVVVMISREGADDIFLIVGTSCGGLLTFGARQRSDSFQELSK